ncbi:MAG: LPS export ABC transporter periplasmic protein LptC [candidate division WOR-3 bacterium]
MDKKKTMAMGMDTSKILMIFFILFFSCSEENKKEEIKIDEDLEEIKKVKIIEYKEKDKLFELFSEDIVSKEKILKAKKLDIIIYDKGIKNVYIKADSGNYSEKGNVELKGNVKLFNYEGDTLWTSYLLYDFNEGIIKSDTECKLFQKGKYIRGKGFESKKPFKKIKIFGKVEGISK